MAVIEDATASPPPHHEAGLRRIAGAGGVITNCKGIHYEWVRDSRDAWRGESEAGNRPAAA